MKKLTFLIFLLASGCSNPEQPDATDTNYFPLKSYFLKEAGRLQKLDPEIKKSVSINGKSETKTVKIASWEKEFSSFIDADINKRAWSGEFKKQVNDTTERYTSNNKNVAVKSVTIEKNKGQITGIVILVTNKNYLYTSTDTLSYYPGKQYGVAKAQQIKLLAEKKYRVNGVFP